MKRLIRRKVKFNLAGMFGNILLAASLSVLPVSAQQIITDGNTATNLNVNGSTTTVTTTTTKGSNAFNSFSKFNVDAGNKVELVVPDASDNLINLVHDEATVINGTLNSIKTGQVGGNIFLVNPHGITVGSQGVINVGSLTAVTPTTNFMNNFFNAPGDPADASITALINGTAPINTNAIIDNQGKINAITDIKIDTGSYYSSGKMYTDANYGLDMGDIVNLNTLDYVAGNNYNNLTLENGSITINAETSVTASNNMFAGDTVDINSNGLVTMNMATVAGDTTIDTAGTTNISGLFDGDTTVNAGDIELTNDLYSDGGDINLTATGTIDVAEDVLVSSRDLNDVFNDDHMYDSIQGYSGLINFIANDITLSDNSKIIGFGRHYLLENNSVSFEANNIDIGLATVISTNYIGTLSTFYRNNSIQIWGGSFTASDSLAINSNGSILPNGITFVVDSLDTKNLNSDFINYNNPLSLTTNSTIEIGNISNIFVDNQQLIPTSINLDAYKDCNLIGINKVSGDINLSSSTRNAYIGHGSNIYTEGSIKFLSSGFISDSSRVGADNDIIFEAGGSLGGSAYARAGNNIIINGEKVSVRGGSITAGNNIILNPSNELYITNSNFLAGNLIEINGGDILNNGIEFSPNSIKCQQLQSNFLNPINITSNDRVVISNLNEIVIGNNVFEPTSIDINAGYQILRNISNSGKINLSGGTIILENISSLGNISLSGEKVDLKNISSSGNEINVIGSQEVWIKSLVEVIGSSSNLIINSDGTVDPSSSITPNISGNNVIVDSLSYSGGIIDITTPNLYGYYDDGMLRAYSSNKNINIKNNSTLNLVLENINTNASGQIIVNGAQVSSDITGANGRIIEVVYDSSSTGFGDINVQNNSTSDVNLTGSIESNSFTINSDGTINSGAQIVSAIDFDASDIYVTNNMYSDGGDINLAATGAIDIVNGVTVSSNRTSSNDLLLLVNSDGSIDPSSTITPTISGDDIIVDSLSAGGGTIDITGTLIGDGTLSTYGSGNIQITNHSTNNLVISNIDTDGSGQIILNGSSVTSDINNPFGVIGVVYNNSQAASGDLNVTAIHLAAPVANEPSLTFDGNINVGNDFTLVSSSHTNINGTIIAGNNIDCEVHLHGFGPIFNINGNMKAKNVTLYSDNEGIVINGLIEAIGDQVDNRALLINADGSIDPSSTITPIISGNDININENSLLANGGIINFSGEWYCWPTGNGTLKAYTNSGNINIINNSNLNLNINNLSTIGSEGKILFDGQEITEDINNSLGVISVVFDDSSAGLGDIALQNNSTSEVNLTGTIESNSFTIASNGVINSDAEVLGAIDFDASDIYVTNNLYSDGGDINLTASRYVRINNLNDNTIIVSSRDLNDVFNEDHLTAISQGNSGDVNFISNNKVLILDTDLLTYADNSFIGGNITLNSNYKTLIYTSDIISSANVQLNASKVSIIQSDDDIIKANQLSLNPIEHLNIARGKYDVAIFNVSSGDVLNNGICFIPDQIITNVFNADFVDQNNDINLISNSDIILGNLSNIIIDGTPLNLDTVNLSSNINVGLLCNLSHINNLVAQANEHLYLSDVDLNAVNVSLNSNDRISILDGNLKVSDTLDLITPNIESLIPELIDVNNLNSNIITPNSPLVLDVNNGGWSWFGNFENILVNNQKLNPTSITINKPGATVYIRSNLLTSGDISIHAADIELSTSVYNLFDITGEAPVLSGNNVSLVAENNSIQFRTGEIHANNEVSLNSDYLNLSGSIFAGGGSSVNNTLLINSNGSIDPSSSIIPMVSGNDILINSIPSGGTINITGNINGTGTLKAYRVDGNINILNNSNLNLNLNNLYNSGKIIVNGSEVTDNITTLDGIINVLSNGSPGTFKDITIQNNSASSTKLTGNINANSLNINSQGPIYLFNDVINSDVVLNTTTAGVDGGNPEIALGYWGLNSNLTINGNLSATATNGNIYYYGGTVNGNAVFNAGEAFDHRISVALGRFRPLNITGDLDVNSAGNVVHFGGLIGGNATVNAGKMVGFMNVNIGGDLDVDAQAFGFFGGSVGGDMNIDADQGILIGIGNLLTVNGNADLDSLYGPVGYYLGDVGGSLTIDAGGVVNVGNVDLLTQQTIDYNGQTYDITDLPYPVPADNNNFTVGSNLTINTPDDVEFEGQVSGLVNVAGDNITHIENGNVNIGTMNSTEGDIGIEANTGSVDINYISTTGDIDINARDGININTIDPANINLFVQKEGGSVNINTAQASNSVNIKADNVQGIFQNLNSSKALEFNVVGNDGNLANNVNISAASNTGLVFNSLKSVNADLKNLTSNTNLKVNNAVVTNKITISSDYIDAKDNVIFNDVNVSGTSGSPKTVNISGLDTSNIQNSVMNKADSIINLPARTDIRDSITLDNDINQVNQTATEKLGEDLVYNVENSEGSFSAESTNGSIVPDNAEFYLDENYENLTKELLDQANKVYNKALENGESEEQAKEKAKQFLLNYKLNSEVAKKLLEKQDFNNNIKFRKVLKLISLNN